MTAAAQGPAGGSPAFGEDIRMKIKAVARQAVPGCGAGSRAAPAEERGA